MTRLFAKGVFQFGPIGAGRIDERRDFAFLEARRCLLDAVDGGHGFIRRQTRGLAIEPSGRDYNALELRSTPRRPRTDPFHGPSKKSPMTR